MAVTLYRDQVDILGNIVNSRIQTFVEQRNMIRNIQESRFSQRVVDDGLSYGDQIEYYKDLLAQEKKSSVKDKEYISQIKTKLSSLKQLDRAQKFRDEYKASVDNLASQSINIDQHISFLEDRKRNAIDLDMRNAIDDKISEAKVKKFELDNQAVVDRGTFAVNDKSVELINKSINETKSQLNKALSSNNESAINKWQSQLLTLNSSLNGITVENAYNDLKVNSMTKPVTSVDMLNFYKDNASKSGGDTPVFIDNVKYGSMKEYWQGEMNTYLNNSFFNLYNQEKQEEINNAAMKLTPILESKAEQINSEMASLISTPELAPYVAQIDQVKTSLMFDAATKIGQKTLDDYNNLSYSKDPVKNYNTAISKLDTISKKYNVDVSNYADTIVTDFAERKQAAATNIAKGVVEEGLSLEEATRQTPELTIPARTVAETPVTELAKTTINVATGKPTGKEESSLTQSKTEVTPRTEAPKTEIAKPEVPVGSQTPDTLSPASMNQNKITIKSGDTLSALASKYKTTTQNLMKLNPSITDPNKIFAGRDLVVPEATEEIKQ